MSQAPEVTDADRDAYRRQIETLAEAMSIAHNEIVGPSLYEGHTVERVDSFTVGNLEKRFDKIHDHLEFLEEVFDADDFARRITQFVHEVPLAAYDTGNSDAERFLDWLEQQEKLTFEQKDHATLVRCENVVETLARIKRMQHLRFQELLQRNMESMKDWEAGADLWLHANPATAWDRFVSNFFLDDEDTPPVDVVFYAWEGEVRTGLLEASAVRVHQQLMACGPILRTDFVPKFAFEFGSETDQIIADLAELGLVAFG